MRRAAFPLALLALAASGCGAAITGDQAKRRDFLQNPAVKKLSDQQLARLCPSLYPSDYLARPKHYRYTRDSKRFVPNAQQRSAASSAGCTAQGTLPKK